MTLFNASETALWHAEALGWSYTRATETWLQKCDIEWVEEVIEKCPILKFPMPYATALDTQTVSALLDQQNSISLLFRKVLGSCSDDPSLRIEVPWVAPWGRIETSMVEQAQHTLGVGSNE